VTVYRVYVDFEGRGLLLPIMGDLLLREIFLVEFEVLTAIITASFIIPIQSTDVSEEYIKFI
jgi:hypothetical protein